MHFGRLDSVGLPEHDSACVGESQMKVIPLLDPKIAATGCGHFEIETNGVELRLTFETGTASLAEVRFDDVIAFRFRDLMRSAGFPSESFDAIVELRDSEWVRELMRVEPPHIRRSVRDCRHFAMLLSESGYIEVVARVVEYRGKQY